MKSLIAAGLVAALAAAPLTSASADVIYAFTQTPVTTRSPTAAANAPSTLPVITSFDLVVTDEAARNGFTASASNTAAPGSARLDGVLGLSFNIFNAPLKIQPLSFDLADFISQPQTAPGFDRFFINVTATAGGLLSGLVRVDTMDENSWLTFNGSSVVSGRFGSDATTACTANDGMPGCSFSGAQTTTTTVPEPMSIALFGAGLAGLAIVRRHQA